MDAAAYQAFTTELTRRADADGRFRGLVALGSMAARDYLPDDFSDHDFFAVVEPEHAETLRHERGWLPRAEEIALAFRETAHGVKVVYRDGHLLEFAVFTLEELSFARVNRYRVLLDRGGVAARLEEQAAHHHAGSPAHGTGRCVAVRPMAHAGAGGDGAPHARRGAERTRAAR